MVINGKEKVGVENLKNQTAFIDFSQTIDDVYENLEDYNPTKKRRVLIAFDDLVADMESYLKVPKSIRLNATHYFIIKIPNKRELQKISSNYSSDTDFEDYMKLYKDYTKELYSFLVNNTTFSSDNSLRFTKKVL